MARALGPTLTAAALGAALLASASAAPVPAGSVRSREEPPGPVVGVPPAIAAGPAATAGLVAWLGDTGGGGRRVRTAALDGGTLPAPGPAGSGEDGLPAAAFLDDATWVAAARGTGSGSRLWARARTTVGWEPLSWVPPANRWNHHPALAAGGGALWIAWVAEADDPAASTLHAARWNGSAWSAPESIPTGPARGRPGMPALAVDRQGRPAVVWAARDGHDTEIWLSWRDQGRWRAPTPLSHNDVPDLLPSAVFSGGELWTAWASLATDGYRVLTRHGPAGSPGSTWSSPVTVTPGPGSAPRLAPTPQGVAVLWGGRDGTGARTLRASLAGATGGWGPPVDLVPAGATPPAVAPGARGAVLLAWIEGGTLHAGRAHGDGPDRRGGRLEMESAAGPANTVVAGAPAGSAGDVSTDTPDTPSGATTTSPPAPQPQALEEVPRTFSAFGDSITNGVLRIDGDPVSTEGYRAPLRDMLRALLGSAEVLNQGQDGEVTEEGVGRIDNVVRDDDPDAVLILEGTNDITLLVDPPDIALNLRRMAERAFEEKDNVLVFLSLVPPQNRDDFEGPFNRRVDEVNELLPDAAQDTGSVLVDMHTPFDGSADLYSDLVHPTEEGYEVMARTWFGAIKPVALDLTNRGDVDGSGRVDGVDLVRLALAFGAREGEPRYDGAADVNGDGVVDGFDLAILAEFFGTEPGGGDGS